MTEITLDDLTIAEQLLLLACRRSLPGCVAGPCVEMAWRIGCGDRHGEASARHFAALSQLICAWGRRPLLIQAPSSRGVSRDELSILSLVAATQSGNAVISTALAHWLVATPHDAVLMRVARALGFAMRRAGLTLRPPSALARDTDVAALEAVA